MKVGITGASGHVGSVLCRMLPDSGHEVRAMVYDLSEKGLNEVEVETVPGDILDPASLDRFMEGLDAVIHLAAKISIEGDPDGSVRRTNYDGTIEVIKACERNKVGRLVYYSTIHAMNPYPLDEELDETRELVGDNWKGSEYDRSKAEAEMEVYKAVEKGMDAVVIAPTSIMGPYDFHPSLLGQAIIDIYSNNIPALVKGGYDWVDIRDVCEGTIAALEKGRTGEKYLLAGEFLTIKELSQTIGEVSGKKTPSTELPIWMAYLGIPFEKIKSKISGKSTGFTREALEAITHSNPFISKKKSAAELGYQPRTIKESLKDSLEWFRENGMIR